MEALPPLEGVKFWCKGPEKISSLSARRRKELSDFLGFPLPSSEGKSSGIWTFLILSLTEKEIKDLEL